jgi:formylglycine-generating enzyme required for sulfatase activity
MGCSPEDNECLDNEKPPHQVTITKGYWLGQTEVTVGAYRRFAGATGRRMPPEPDADGRPLNPGWGNKAMPIVDVTWYNAQAYCSWAGGRLPTEAEWEYAARGGSTAARYGDLDEIAWYADNSGRQRFESERIFEKGDEANDLKRLDENGNGMHEVAQKRANAFGLYDMLGNVFEWVNDWDGDKYYQSSPSQNPAGPTSGTLRVLRGGSWGDTPGRVRVSFRGWNGPGGGYNVGVGIRCGGEVFAPSIPQNEIPQRAVSAPAIGTVRENLKDGLKYVWIPPGTFTMGCSPEDDECLDNEKPPHQVTITKGYWLGQTEVTVGAYKRFAGAIGRRMPPEPEADSKPLNPGWGDKAMPIVDVSWYNAQAYCSWAGGRLPTEAEWEYAARGGSTAARYGDPDEIAWYADNSGHQRLESARIFKEDQANYAKRLDENGNGMHEVAQKRANGFGLYDMLGNVWEQVNDMYDEKYYQHSPLQDPAGPTSGTLRVLRGGSYVVRPGKVRISVRVGYNPVYENAGLGFRCAR